MLVSNPQAPDKVSAKEAAEWLARALREEFPEYTVRIDESINSRFHVVVEVPFRVERLTWVEVTAAKQKEAASARLDER